MQSIRRLEVAAAMFDIYQERFGGGWGQLADGVRRRVDELRSILATQASREDGG